MLKKTKESILIFLRGLLMGSADVIPGVSGGTIAFITGIYPKLIGALSEIDLSLLHKPKKFFQKIDFRFFLPLGLGIIIAILSLAKLINYLLNSSPSYLFAFFFGLILASAVFLFKKVGKINLGKMIFLVFGFVFAYILAGASSLNVNHSLPFIFLSGAVAICAMLLPGISGAFILLLLNQYQYLISAIHDYKISIIAVFGAGALAGILAFSKLLNFLLKKYPHVTVSFLIGLMLGSLRIPLDKITGVSWPVILLVLIGFTLVFILEHFFEKR